MYWKQSPKCVNFKLLNFFIVLGTTMNVFLIEKKVFGSFTDVVFYQNNPRLVFVFIAFFRAKKVFFVRLLFYYSIRSMFRLIIKTQSSEIFLHHFTKKVNIWVEITFFLVKTDYVEMDKASDFSFSNWLLAL